MSCKRCEEISARYEASGEYDPDRGLLQQLWRFIWWLFTGTKTTEVRAAGGRIPGQLIWTCHVCREERPDSKISVHTRKVPIEGTAGVIQENIRYCNDRPECAAGVKNIHFVPKKLGGADADKDADVQLP